MGDTVLEVRSLTKRYGPIVGVEDLDLRVGGGEILGVLGPNGSGKTTLLRLLLGLIRPTRGEVRVFGAPPTDRRVRARVGFLPGDPNLDGRMTGRRMLGFLAALRPRGAPRPPAGRRRALCERLALAPADLERPIRSYSRGMRQKLALVAALEGAPEILVLDEPTSGLDPIAREAALALLREAAVAGRTVVHSSHVLGEVERTCSRVAVLRSGRLAALSSVEDLRRRAVRRMEVRFERPVDPAELRLPGVELVAGDGIRFDLRVAGPIGPLLAVLARHPVGHLAFPEPSLEEAFVKEVGSLGGAP